MGAYGLHRLFENLVSNAVKYDSPYKKSNITLRHDKTLADIRIHNEGEVISLKEQHNSFKLGCGIGLAVVKGLTEAHGGEISLESDLSSGTTFQIKLPLGLELQSAGK